MIKKNVPEVRLKGFSGEWLSQDFEEFFETSISKNTLSRANLTSEPTEVKNIHYGDILINFPSVIDAASDVDTFIKDARFDQYRNQCLKDGDIIFADAAEDETVGKSIEIRIPSGQNVVSGLHTIPCRPKKQVKPFYLGHYLNSNAYHRQLLPLMQGTKVLSISKSSLMKTSLKIPEAQNEQEKLGLSFQNIDRLIAFHSKKYEKLLNVKVAMLAKMFPREGADVPEIRFKGFNDSWKLIDLSDEVDFFSGLTYSPLDIVKEDGTLVLRSSNVQEGEISLKDNVYVRSSAVNSSNVLEGDIIVVVRNGSRNLIGKHAQIKKPMSNTVIGAFMTGLRPRRSSFINALLDTNLFSKEVEKNLGATINQITTGMFKKMQFMIPKSEEQKAIGSYFDNLNELIVLQRKELEKLKNIKKAMLEKMFI